MLMAVAGKKLGVPSKSKILAALTGIVVLLASNFPSMAQGGGPKIRGCTVFPEDSIWNTPVNKLPIDPHSKQYIQSIGSDKGIHPDFGSAKIDGAAIGIPFVVVPMKQPKVAIAFKSFGDETANKEESDAGPYPVPKDASVEGGLQSKDDRHVIVIQEGSCTLFELFKAVPGADGSWDVVSAAKFDLEGHQLRPDGRTSADAAGLPIFPGLVRAEEIAAGEIKHALRFTAPKTRKATVWPARHFASNSTDEHLPPLGQRFRLRADFDVSKFSPVNQIILRALQKYGMMLADNGSAWFLSGSPHSDWNDDQLRELRKVTGINFEAVDVSSLMDKADSGKAHQP